MNLAHADTNELYCYAIRLWCKRIAQKAFDKTESVRTCAIESSQFRLWEKKHSLNPEVGNKEKRQRTAALCIARMQWRQWRGSGVHAVVARHLCWGPILFDVQSEIWTWVPAGTSACELLELHETKTCLAAQQHWRTLFVCFLHPKPSDN